MRVRERERERWEREAGRQRGTEGFLILSAEVIISWSVHRCVCECVFVCVPDSVCVWECYLAQAWGQDSERYSGVALVCVVRAACVWLCMFLERRVRRGTAWRAVSTYSWNVHKAAIVVQTASSLLLGNGRCSSVSHSNCGTGVWREEEESGSQGRNTEAPLQNTGLKV